MYEFNLHAIKIFNYLFFILNCTRFLGSFYEKPLMVHKSFREFLNARSCFSFIKIMCESFNITRDQLHRCLLYDFHSGGKVYESLQNLCKAFDDSVIRRQCTNGSINLNKGIFIKDKPRSVALLNNHELISFVEDNAHLTTQAIERIVKIVKVWI